MSQKLTMLKRKIESLLENREFPIDIKEKIENIYNEYRTFYEENLRKEILMNSNTIISNNIENYFEENYNAAINSIQNKYKEKCRENAEVIGIIISTLDNRDEQVEKLEIDILGDYIKNDRENYSEADDIIEIVIESIKDSKNQLFRTLDSLGTTEQKMEYIDTQIKLIENTAKLRVTEIKEGLDFDDKNILEQIFAEYEQYKCENGKKDEEKAKDGQEQEKSSHQKFVDQYRVSEEDLIITKKEDLEDKIKREQEKEYEELPGDVIR